MHKFQTERVIGISRRWWTADSKGIQKWKAISPGGNCIENSKPNQPIVESSGDTLCSMNVGATPDQAEIRLISLPTESNLIFYLTLQFTFAFHNPIANSGQVTQHREVNHKADNYFFNSNFSLINYNKAEMPYARFGSLCG